ncbi:baseplate J/gp47 family protein [Microbacterium sp. A93]|uniref:baseplate J/gp47 family protein n=1 Tax=Microbacterium sp. A93 TaxID=3450716 RepID=UPI003F420E84
MSTADHRARLADVPAALLGVVDREARRAAVAGSEAPEPTGIDFVEVVSMERTMEVLSERHRLPRWRTLLVQLMRGPVPSGWDASRVAITGGVRQDPAVNPVEVVWAYPARAVTGAEGGPVPTLPPGLKGRDRRLVSAVVDPSRRDRVLVVRTRGWGDLSGYVLRILRDDAGAGLPAELDAPLAQDRFSFAIDCPNPFDCRSPAPGLPDVGEHPVLDYTARDYPALRQRLMDRMASLVPGWREESSADGTVMLLELMAHLGDVHAYRQDAAVVEAYLSTARRRTSVRRHARLLGYPVQEGCAARTWLALEVEGAVDLAAGAGVADVGVDPAVPGTPRTPVQAHEAGATVFETTRGVAVRPSRNMIELHPWSDRDHVLAAGSTAAFLATPAGVDPGLVAGDVIVLAELPHGGRPEPWNGDPGHRQAVRLSRDPVVIADAYAPGTTVWEIRWETTDALDAPLVVSEPGGDGRPVVRAVALCNVVLADAGATLRGERLDQVHDGGGAAGLFDGRPRTAYRPRLSRPGVVWVHAVDPEAGPTGGAPSARAALETDPARARAAVGLDDGSRTWAVRPDLIASSALDTHLVAEPEPDPRGPGADGSPTATWLRFGDGTFGREPADGTDFTATYRVGPGAGGNVAPGALTETLLGPGHEVVFPAGVRRVWNPVSARGGSDPEPSATVRQMAPRLIGRQERAVNTQDHQDVAEAVDGVQRAVARRRWTGSWHAVEVMVDPVQDRGSSLAPDPGLPGRVLERLESRRMAAIDVEVRRPLWVPVRLTLTGCVLAGYRAVDVAFRIRRLLSAGVLPDGTRGLFHPDRLTFGTPVRLSDVVGTAMQVPGIAWIEPTQLRRLTDTDVQARGHLLAGLLQAGAREVIRCDSDPNQPEFGRVEVTLGEGGGHP